MIVFCPSCNADRDASIRQMEESYPVKGDTITITANVMVCGVCGEQSTMMSLIQRTFSGHMPSIARNTASCHQKTSGS